MLPEIIKNRQNVNIDQRLELIGHTSPMTILLCTGEVKKPIKGGGFFWISFLLVNLLNSWLFSVLICAINYSDRRIFIKKVALIIH